MGILESFQSITCWAASGHIFSLNLINMLAAINKDHILKYSIKTLNLSIKLFLFFRSKFQFDVS